MALAALSPNFPCVLFAATMDPNARHDRSSKKEGAEEEETDIEPEGEVDDELAKVRENVADFSEEDEDSTEE